MFQKSELARLEERKALLVSQSDANRRLLADEWQRLRSPENWVNEAAQLARRHPVWTAALSALGGVLAVQTVRKPGTLFSGLGRLGKLATTAFSVWRLMRRDKTNSK